MKLLAPGELLEQLRRRGMLCRPGWPVPAADFGTIAGADLVIGPVTEKGGAREIGDLVPVPCALGTVASVIAGWWATTGWRGASWLALSGGASGACEVLDAEQACSTDTVLAAVRRLYRQHSGEWSWVELSPGSTSGRLLEWRFLDWTIRLGHPDDPGRIEVELPLGPPGTHGQHRAPGAVRGRSGRAQSGAERGGATRTSRLLTERVDRLERRAGAVLVHLVTSPGGDGAALEGPLRLPTTLQVSLVTIAATAGDASGRGGQAAATSGAARAPVQSAR